MNTFTFFKFSLQKSLISFPIVSLLFATVLPASPQIQLGIDYLENRQFDILNGKKVGLLTHPAGVNSKSRSTVLIFHTSPAVNLVALFGPEHGIYGDEKASVPVDDKVDHHTRTTCLFIVWKISKANLSDVGQPGLT